MRVETNLTNILTKTDQDNANRAQSISKQGMSVTRGMFSRAIAELWALVDVALFVGRTIWPNWGIGGTQQDINVGHFHIRHSL